TGTKIEGVVTTAKVQHDKDPGVLELSFRRLRLPNGRSYPITGSLIGLDNKSVNKTSDGRLIAKPGHQTDRLTYVGYGAGAGLLISLFTHKTLENTLLGAGLGYLFGSLQKSNPSNVNLKSGTELGVRLDRSVTVATGENDGGISDNADRASDPSDKFH